MVTLLDDIQGQNTSAMPMVEEYCKRMKFVLWNQSCQGGAELRGPFRFSTGHGRLPLATNERGVFGKQSRGSATK